MSTSALIQDEQHQRLEVKLRRELGERVLRLLDDNLTEDILLNPDGSLWVKRMGWLLADWRDACGTSGQRAWNHRGVAGNRTKSRTSDP